MIITPDSAAKMNVIINIQMMNEVIHENRDIIPFETLEHMSIEDLRQLQEETIPDYNKAVTFYK